MQHADRAKTDAWTWNVYIPYRDAVEITAAVAGALSVLEVAERSGRLRCQDIIDGLTGATTVLKAALRDPLTREREAAVRRD